MDGGELSGRARENERHLHWAKCRGLRKTPHKLGSGKSLYIIYVRFTGWVAFVHRFGELEAASAAATGMKPPSNV